jgi:hypothetical protein
MLERLARQFFLMRRLRSLVLCSLLMNACIFFGFVLLGSSVLVGSMLVAASVLTFATDFATSAPKFLEGFLGSFKDCTVEIHKPPPYENVHRDFNKRGGASRRHVLFEKLQISF